MQNLTPQPGPPNADLRFTHTPCVHSQVRMVLLVETNWELVENRKGFSPLTFPSSCLFFPVAFQPWLPL